MEVNTKLLQAYEYNVTGLKSFKFPKTKKFFVFGKIVALLLQLETICGNGGSKFEACYHLLLLEIYLFRVKT